MPVFHDKSIFHSNELCHQVYICDGKMPLQKKGQEHAIHVSDFIVVVEETGCLTLSEHQLEENASLPNKQQLQCTDAHEVIYPGKNNDGFWTNDKLVKQVSHNLCQI